MRQEGMGHTEGKSTRRRVEDGIRQGVGVLSAFKEAIQEVFESEDLQVDRAKQAMKDAIESAQAVASNARKGPERVNRTEFDALRERVVVLEQRTLGDRMSHKEPEGD